jgi:hypothetical protein
MESLVKQGASVKEAPAPAQVERAIALLELAPAAAAGQWDSVFADSRPHIRRLLATGNIRPSFEAFVEQSGRRLFWLRCVVTPTEQSFTVGSTNYSSPFPGVHLRVTDGSNTHEIPWEPKDKPTDFYRS